MVIGEQVAPSLSVGTLAKLIVKPSAMNLFNCLFMIILLVYVVVCDTFKVDGIVTLL